MFLLQDGRSLDKERRLSTSHVRRTTPNRITRALSIPIEGSRAQKQAITVAGAVAVAAVTAAVVTWAVSGISAFFARRRPPGPPRPPGGSGPPRPPHAGAAGLIAGLLSTVPAGVLLGSMLGPAPSNAEAADESNTSAAAAEPVGPQAIDGEWVFMPSSMRLLLEHFDFELSKAENEDQIEGGSARLRLSSLVEAPNIQNAVALLPYLKPERVLQIDAQAWSELLIAKRLPLESNCLVSARHLPTGSIVVLVCHNKQVEGHARQSALSAISAFTTTTDLVVLDSSSQIPVYPHV